MLILFKIAPNWKQLQCQSTGELLLIHTMEYNSTIKWNGYARNTMDGCQENAERKVISCMILFK